MVGRGHGVGLASRSAFCGGAVCWQNRSAGGVARGEIRTVKPSFSCSKGSWQHSGNMAALLDAVERAQLSDLFDELGPQAPTLLEPWVTRDLAAHLVQRDRDYLAGPGLVLLAALDVHPRVVMQKG